MTPIISPWIFYALSVVDAVKGISIAAMVIAIAGALVVGAIVFIDDLDLTPRLVKIVVIPLVTSVVLSIFIPSEKTITKMIVAQNVTYERVEVIGDTVETVYNDIMSLFEQGESDG